MRIDSTSGMSSPIPPSQNSGKIGDFTPTQKQYLQQFESDLEKMIQSGKINPAVLQHDMSWVNLLIQSQDPPLSPKQVDDLQNAYNNMKQALQENNPNLLVDAKEYLAAAISL